MASLKDWLYVLSCSSQMKGPTNESRNLDLPTSGVCENYIPASINLPISYLPSTKCSVEIIIKLM